MIFPNDQQHC